MKRIGRPPRPEIAAAGKEMVEHGIPARAFLAYCDQVHNCHQAGVKMELTLKEWWDWWQENDRWASRGRGRNQIMMLRRDMSRGFSLDNIYVGTNVDKRRQSEAARTVTEKMLAARTEFGKRASARMAQRDRHPKRQPCEGPQGTFPSVSLAAEATGIMTSTLWRWCKNDSHGWHFVPKLRERPMRGPA